MGRSLIHLGRKRENISMFFFYVSHDCLRAFPFLELLNDFAFQITAAIHSFLQGTPGTWMH